MERDGFDGADRLHRLAHGLGERGALPAIKGIGHATDVEPRGARGLGERRSRQGEPRNLRGRRLRAALGEAGAATT